MESVHGEIITFYSYKGGVGRSMALANVACLLAQKRNAGGDTLMIDWDLEAPGLHQFFHGRFENPNSKLGDLPQGQLGLIDLFYEIKDWLESNNSEGHILEDLFEVIDIRKYIVKTAIPSLLFMPAGRFEDGMYSTRVNEFDWADFFDKFPSVITKFAQYLRKKFKHVLIDSRTGYTDISGICTSLMPEKLVVVFTPNRQSLSGIIELIRRATEYRKQSDDLRPLMIFPLPSRIENAENDLQKDWRFGNSDQGIKGYQSQLESILVDVYSLQKCDLTKYFDEYQLQYKPKYSYGEEIAVLSERSGDRLSLARSFKNFTEKLISNDVPWEDIMLDPTKTEREKREVGVDELSRQRTASKRRTILQSLYAITTVTAIVLMYLSFSNYVLPLFVQSQSALQFLYNLFNWQYFGILAIIWMTIDLIWVGRWRALIGRLGKLITKPWVFIKDKEPHEPPLYPREFLEQLALNSRRETKLNDNSKKSTRTKDDGNLAKWTSAQRDRIFDPENPIRSLGYVISLAFFVFFLITDAITVAATLVLMGVISPDLPPILQRSELAILGGTLLSTVVGVWMIVEMSGKGELINTDALTGAQKKIYKLFAVTVTLFAVAVMVALAVQRLVSLGSLQASPTTNLILSFVLYGLLAVNNSLAAALTFQPAAPGFIVVMYLLFILIIGILPILAYLADILWRGLYMTIDILIWVLFTPIIAIPFGIGKVFGQIDGGDYPKDLK